MYKLSAINASLLAVMLCGSAQAADLQPIKYTHPIKASATVTKPSAALSIAKKKDVYLMNINLSAKQKHTFFNAARLSKTLKVEPTNAPPRADMGMNGTPVLDQGRHGSCVTFAVTGALDALMGKGDYISQLCSLSLGSHLEKNGYIPSGWDGSIGDIVLNQIQNFGFINKTNQEKNSCGGLKKYPLLDETNIGMPMALDEFKAMSEPMGEYGVFSQQLLTLVGRMGFDPNYTYNPDRLVNNIKEALATPQQDGYNFRVIFATLLPVEYCSAGACGRLYAANDTWTLSDTIQIDDQLKVGGHEMIITGYDDNAVVTDDLGMKHTGVFKLRNSWGDDVGNKGDYYMTYDFFKIFAMDVTKIIFPKD
jgi:hypothetical protein